LAKLLEESFKPKATESLAHYARREFQLRAYRLTNSSRLILKTSHHLQISMVALMLLFT
jgi:hypothetical protein